MRYSKCRSKISTHLNGRKRHGNKGQIVIAAAVIIAILLLSLSDMAYHILIDRQDIQVKPVQDLTQVITASFREALTAALANLTQTYNKTGDMNLARMNALQYLSGWKLTAMNAYSSEGLQVDFDIHENSSDAYMLQPLKKITYNGLPETLCAWNIYNLSQLYWNNVSSCSAAYATLYINLTEYGLYGWSQNVPVCTNVTLYPDNLRETGSRTPADVVLVLDASGSMFWNDLTHMPNMPSGNKRYVWSTTSGTPLHNSGRGGSTDRNDLLKSISGTVPVTGTNTWTTVSTINFGEIPEQFVVILGSQSNNLNIRLIQGNKILSSTTSTTATGNNEQDPRYGFGKTYMQTYGKNGTWQIQLQNTGSGSAGYSIQVQARKVDCLRNAATSFLELLNPKYDKLGIVQFGTMVGYYYASIISSDPFYNLATSYTSAYNDINYRTPQISSIGYGFEMYKGTEEWGDNTPLGAGLELGNYIFHNYARVGSHRIMILITDGKENVEPSGNPPKENYGPPWDTNLQTGQFYNPNSDNPSSFYSIAQNLTGQAYKINNITTYTIGFGRDADNASLTMLAKYGGGAYYYAANGTRLSQILANLVYMLNDQFTFKLSLNKEHKIGINTLALSSLTVYFYDNSTGLFHKVTPSHFSYEGCGNFLVTVGYAGTKHPSAIYLNVVDPRGIYVQAKLDYADWGG